MLIKEVYNPNHIQIPQYTTVGEALALLANDEVNALLVTDLNDKVCGVLSIQDIAGATIPEQFRSNIRIATAMYRKGFFTQTCQELKSKPVSSIMRRTFVTVTLDDNIMAVTADFLKNDLYIVPVVDELEKVVGVVTRTEIKKALVYGMREL